VQETGPVLVIDDDPTLCDMVNSVLTIAGFKVVTATDGPSGIELARTMRPALILLDMVMPGLDGIGTCQRLKHERGLADIPVVGITASSDLTYTRRAFRAGAEFFLAKPFGSQSLIQVVNLAAQKARGETHDSRHHPRFAAKLSARCHVLDEQEKPTREVMGCTGNVSLGGVMVWLTEPLAQGTMVQLELELPGKAVTAHGKVVWRKDEVGGLPAPHGIQFLGFLDDANYLHYRRYLKEIAAERLTAPIRLRRPDAGASGAAPGASRSGSS